MDAKAAASTSSAVLPIGNSRNTDEDAYDPALMDFDHNNRSGGDGGDPDEGDIQDGEELELDETGALDTSMEDGAAANTGLGPASAVMQASTSNTGSRSQNKPHVLLAVYSSVPVYEFMIRGIGVMRRRSDSWINATQLLKVAGIEKGKRTKILDKDIAAPDSGIQFEKVQGGYGRYQGTWIPFHEAAKMAEQYGILDLVRPLLEYQPAPSQAPLAGLSSQSPNTTLTPIDQPQMPSTNAGQQQQYTQQQGQVANPQQQRLQQQQLQQSAQSMATLPIPRPHGIAPAQQAGSSQMQTQLDNASSSTSRKRPRQPGSEPNSSTSLNGQQGTDSVDAGTANANKRARTDPTATTTAATVDGTAAQISRIRKASKHPEPSQNSADAGVLEEHRSALMSLFMSSESNLTSSTSSLETEEIDPSTVVSSFPTGLDPDLAIDGQQHTALHWACALGRLSTVQALIELGADCNRGNEAGETPLMRAVLVTNNFDTETFAPPHLLTLLAGSLRTVDDMERTVLHHIALVAGIKGRSAAARHYMESILHYLAEEETEKEGDENSRDLIDAQDSNGDTALNIAARVGSRPMVRMLLESGADQKIPNKLGLRAGDFGLLEEGLIARTAAEIAVDQIQAGTRTSAANLGSSTASSTTVISSEQRSADVLASVSSLLTSLASDFSTELSSRTDSLNRTKTQLHLATKDLADQRQNLASLREKVRQVEISKWRIRNLEKALQDEDQFDWTGRTGLDGEPAFQEKNGSPDADGEEDEEDPSIDPSLNGQDKKATIRAAFEYRGPSSVLKAMPAVNMPMNIDADAPLPASAVPFSSSATTSSSSPPPPPPSQLTLVQLRRMVIWYEQVISLLSGRVEAVKENNGELELDARRLVKICTGVSVDEDVEGMLDNLITALESDGAEGSGPDLQRVSKFMAKVKSAEVVDPSPAPQ